MVVLTLFQAEALGPFLQGDVFVVVSITLIKEAGGAMLHGDQRSTQRGQLRVGQVSNTHTHTHTKFP